MMDKKAFIKTLAPYFKKRGRLFWSFLCLAALSFVLAGCSAIAPPSGVTSKQRTMKSYLTQIDKTDGIERDEALLLAKSQVIFRGKETNYDLNKPDISSDEKAWVLTFPPIHKTLGELLSPTNLIIRVDKKDGRIDWLEQ